MDASVCRPARPEELEEVYRMGYDAWADGDGVEAYLAACAASPKYARGRWLVLEGDGSLLSSLIVYDLGGPSAGLGSIATAPERRGRGYASALVAAAAGAIEGAGKSRVFLFSDIGPEFYERLGFRALPARFQMKKGTSCMVRTKDFDATIGEPGFAPPEYF